MNKGFTLVELMISVTIFMIMKVLLVVKFGSFNQSVLITNISYDAALVIRQAQNYGIGVANSSKTTTSFQYPYGVSFSTGATCADASAVCKTRIVLFTDNSSANGIYTDGSDVVPNGGIYNITRGAYISNLCTGSGPGSCSSVVNLNISFKRPDPTAIICGSSCSTLATYAEITIMGPDSSTRKLIIRSNGYVSLSS